MKKYILIAGVNGAGKSTLYQTLHSLHEMIRINTDEIVRKLGDWRSIKNQIEAGKIAVSKLKECFENELTFNQETTLCGKSVIGNIVKAKEKGYSIELHYVGVDSVEIAKERVRFRVEHGGHGIPEQTIEKRYIESLQNLQKVLPLCDLAMLYARSLEMTPAEVETLLAYGFTESDLDEMAFDRQYREECKAMCL